jgi:Uma2 family endonuclease
MRCNVSVTPLADRGDMLSHAPLPPVAEAEHTMVMPAIDVPRWTAEAVRALPEEPGKRFECVDGELLVSPSPRLPHQSALGAFLIALSTHTRAHACGAVFMAPTDLELDPYTLVQPDLLVLPLVNGRRPVEWHELGRPLLLVEVLSPSTARFDRVVKRARYQREGVEYWIVDLEARLVERWTPNADRPEILTDEARWHPADVSEPCVIPLAPLFAEALGER